MSLLLHAEVTRDEALHALGLVAGEHVDSYLDGAFSIVNDSIACFFDVTPERCTLETSTRFEWRQPPSSVNQPPFPRAFPEVRARMAEVWPTPVVDTVLERAGNKVVRRRRHEIFLRSPAHDRYVYAGPAHLGSHSLGGDASFALDQRLPRALWLRFGGYAGWRCDLAHEPRVVADGDIEALSGILGDFAAQPFGHLVLTRYEEDALHVFKNERCAFLMYLRAPDDGGLYVDRGASSSPASDERFECACGILLTYSVRHTAPIDEALAITRAFFDQGHLPEDRKWTEDLET